MRRRKFIFLNLVGLLLGASQTFAAAQPVSDFPVEVVEVKELGLSDRDESKSVIEIRWRVGETQKEKIVAFHLILSVTYADGATVTEKRKFEKTIFSARLEVPSVKTFGGRNPAVIKKTVARVSATISKN